MTEMIMTLPNKLSNRQAHGGHVLLLGLLAGAAAFVLAQVLTPQAATPGEHNLLLAQRLSLLLTPLVALWLGWLRGSERCALVGVVAGLGVGALASFLSSGLSARAVLLIVPALIGGILAASCGSCPDDHFRSVSKRFGKGVLAGSLMAWSSFILFHVGSLALWPTSGNVDYMDAYVRMMWRTGPLAFGLSAALFFLLVRWAAGLDRPIEAVRSRRLRSTRPLPPLGA